MKLLHLTAALGLLYSVSFCQQQQDSNTNGSPTNQTYETRQTTDSDGPTLEGNSRDTSYRKGLELPKCDLPESNEYVNEVILFK